MCTVSLTMLVYILVWLVPISSSRRCLGNCQHLTCNAHCTHKHHIEDLQSFSQLHNSKIVLLQWVDLSCPIYFCVTFELLSRLAWCCEGLCNGWASDSLQIKPRWLVSRQIVLVMVLREGESPCAVWPAVVFCIDLVCPPSPSPLVLGQWEDTVG